MSKSKIISAMGLLIALDVTAAAFLTIRMPSLKIGVSFIPVSLTGILFGPLLGGTGAAVADILQYLMFPGGVYIPGITADAFLCGAVYGLLLHGRQPSFLRCLFAAAICRLGIDAFLSTYWLYLVTPGKTFAILFFSRAVNCLVMTPVSAAVIYAAWRLSKRVRIFTL